MKKTESLEVSKPDSGSEVIFTDFVIHLSNNWEQTYFIFQDLDATLKPHWYGDVKVL